MTRSAAKYDVAVVGAGPAGASAAYRLASGGARCVVLERAPPPRYKTCGGGIVARAEALLPFALGTIVEEDCRRAQLNLADHGLQFQVERTAPIVRMAMREHLDRHMLQHALEAGAELVTPCEVTDLQAGPTGITLSTSRGPVTARLVVGCDGAPSRTARRTGEAPQQAVMPACEWEVYVADPILDRFRGIARFDFGLLRAGYAWIFPKRDHLSIGLGRTYPGPLRCRPLLDAYMHRAGVTDVRHVERHGHVIPRRSGHPALLGGRVLLAGDAGGFVDPVLCEGITYAVRTGQLAADAALESGLDSALAGIAYLRELRREVLPELRAGRLLARVLYEWPGLSALLFRHKGMLLCEAMTDVVMGKRSYQGLLSQPRSYVRLLLGNAGAGILRGRHARPHH